MNFSELRELVDSLGDVTEIIDKIDVKKDIESTLLLSKMKDQTINLKLGALVSELGNLRAAIVTKDTEKKNKAILKIAQYKDVGDEINLFEKEIAVITVKNDLGELCQKQKKILVAFGEIFKELISNQTNSRQ